MSQERTRPPLRTGGALWGPRRVAAGISLAELAAESGVAKPYLSLFENGRAIPRGDEYERVVAALERLTTRPAA